MGMQDIFISCMLWFIMDSENKPNFVENRNTGEVYQILDVLKSRNEEEDSVLESLSSNLVNDDSSDEDNETFNYSRGSLGSGCSGIS